MYDRLLSLDNSIKNNNFLIKNNCRSMKKMTSSIEFVTYTFQHWYLSIARHSDFLHYLPHGWCNFPCKHLFYLLRMSECFASWLQTCQFLVHFCIRMSFYQVRKKNHFWQKLQFPKRVMIVKLLFLYKMIIFE